jgi:hypothetical protein
MRYMIGTVVMFRNDINFLNGLIIVKALIFHGNCLLLGQMILVPLNHFFHDVST